MKRLVTYLLLLAIVTGIASFWTWNVIANQEIRDYRDIIAYVSKVEKEGFNQVDFEKFSYLRHVRYEGVILIPVPIRWLNFFSLIALMISFGIVVRKWPRDNP